MKIGGIKFQRWKKPALPGGLENAKTGRNMAPAEVTAVFFIKLR